MKSDNPGLEVWESQTPATLTQGAPVQNTWYEILPGTANCIVYDAVVNIEDTNETLEVRVTIEGRIIPAEPFAAAHSTNHNCRRFANAINGTERVALVVASQQYAYLWEGKSVKLEVRKTTAAGVGDLTGIVTFGVKKHA